MPQPSVAAPAGAWECAVCGEDSECEGSYLLQCDMCRVCVHMDCIGEEREPDGSLWLCDMCELRHEGVQVGVGGTPGVGTSVGLV
eukprot:148934-Chlamydomonas_euryale.AAC.2